MRSGGIRLGRRVCATLAFALGASPSGGVAWAQAVPEGATAAEARSHFEAGVSLSRAQRWADALAAFERARALDDQPGTALNIAVLQRLLGRLVAARQTLRECLAMPQLATEPDLGRDAALLLALVSDSIARVSLSVDPPDAAVIVDGVPAVDPRDIELDPGEHRLVARAPDHQDGRLDVSVAAGERASRSLRLALRPARVAMTVTPREAEVFVNDRAVGRGAVAWEGPSGAVAVRIGHPGYESVRRDWMLAPGELRSEQLALRAARSPWYRSGWLWAGVAAVAVAAGVSAVVLVSAEAPADGGSTGTVLRGP